MLFYNITASTSAGDRDWTSLVGSTLCRACYVRFGRSGSLHQQRKPRQHRVKEQAPSHKRRRGNKGVQLPVDGSGNVEEGCYEDSNCEGGGIKDSDAERLHVDDMDVDYDADVGHEVRMFASDDELPTLQDAQQLHKSFVKLRPSMLVKDNEYISTESDSESGDAHAEPDLLLLSQSEMPDLRNASECLLEHP